MRASVSPSPLPALSATASQAIFASSASLVSSQDEQQLLGDLCVNAVMSGRHRLAWYGRPLLDGSFAMQPIACAGEASAYLDELVVTWDASPTGDGAVGSAARSRQVVTIHDVTAVRRQAIPIEMRGQCERAREFELRSITAVPVFVQGELDGVLAVYSDRPGVFDEVAQAVHLALTQQVGVGLGSLRAARRVSESLKGAVKALSATIEARDPYTAGHQNAVSMLVERIARRLDLPDFDIEGVMIGGLVHDIGKVAVPLDVLLSPTPLSPQERSLMQTHVTHGEAILSDIDFPWPVGSIVGQHHERLDGSGYPQRLAGDEILLPTRIVMVADVFDALTADRPYRQGFSIAQSRAYLADSSGTLFDRDVVAAMLAVDTHDLYQKG